ncbi:MAG: hypothetical protein K2G89_05645 [Lachnospiraceae bacterium]|nr:hypothetical protein [Lachnospiraceae bacterium]
MNSELLQNQDVLIRLLVLAVPTIVAFLVSVIYTMVAGKGEKTLKDVTSMFLAVCATSFFYMVIEVMLIFYYRTGISVEMVINQSVVLFVLLGVLNAISCLAKGIISGSSLKNIAGANKQTVMSRALIYMSIAELPGLAALVVYLVTFMK